NLLISCFWETQPLGCVRISCVFHHSKPRNINGLFLPPSSNATLQKEVQEGTLHPAHSQEPMRGQETILRPIHPPLIINLSLEEEEEEEEEKNYACYLLTKTAADIEEEKAIKEMCHKSGEYYRIQTLQDNHSAKTMSSALDNEQLKPMETGRDLQEGDGVTVPTKFNNIERQGEVAASLDGNTRTDFSAFENGGGDGYIPQRRIFIRGKRNEELTGEKELILSHCYFNEGIFQKHVFFQKINLCHFSPLAMNHTEPVKKHHFKGVKKKKWISEESKNLSSTFAGKGILRNHLTNYKNAENTSCVPSQKATRRSISLNSPEPGRSTHMTYNNVKDSKLNLSSGKLLIT
uniref:Chromosome 12 open reading frame 50 n=1 Tax=Pelusios castaneus TaxID=367368 RepID=A0A8C8VFK0_9SAUR